MRVRADALFRARGELHHHLVEAEVGIDRHHQIVDLQDLRLELLLGAEDMRVVLREAAHAHQPVQRARRLVAVHVAELGQPDRQIAVGFQAVLEDLHMAGAVHRLQREDALVGFLVVRMREGMRGLHREHVLLVPAPVAGRLPQRLVEHLRGVDLLIVLVETAAHVGDEVLEHLPALGVPEDDARPLLLEMEEVHLAAELSVVALLGLLQHVQVMVELRLVGPGGAVDARQHRVVGVAAPIGAGHLHQLEGVADLAGRGHVRPAAEVEPVALRVDLEVLVFRDRVDQFELVALALVGKHLSRLLARPDLLGEGFVAADDLAHLLLDDGEVVGRERLVAREVVIEAVLDDRADRHLRAGPKLLHGFGEHMRGVVADEFQRARIVAGDDLDAAGLLQRIGKVAQHAVERVGDGLLRQRLGDRFREFGAGRGGVVAARRNHRGI